jgi:hypothetical protein
MKMNELQSLSCFGSKCSISGKDVRIFCVKNRQSA